MHLPVLDGLTRAFVDDACANCLRPIPEEIAGLFCSSWCAEAAETVRWMRRVTCRDRLDDPEVLRTAHVRLAMLVMGGYQAETRRVPPKVRAFVIERAGGRCEKCSEPGAEVDHIAGHSPDPSNLQYLCKSCHTAKTDAVVFGPGGFQMPQADAMPTDVDEAELPPLDPVREHILTRVTFEDPALLCDDEVEWPKVWRTRRAARKARLLARAEEAGLDATALRGMTWAQIVDEIADALTEDAPAPPDYDGGYGPDSYYARAMNRDG
ncbi:HNH endonuclease [Cellulomonas sp. HD19AZ1]|uniref:HNH endonuclease n=1 Tax=Cellulomonas sp. HD19AZ1 TaxID=2559593 RepID=UPI00197E34CC|nr:HNH endonuclease signature motif containing protein [Cellulomonas sp. HD19AZ1]